MDATAAISFGIGIAGFIAGILWKVIDLSVKFGKIVTRLEHEEKREQEDRERSSAKFSEIYGRLNTTENSIAELTATIRSMSDSLSRIENKIDKVMASIKI